jgi:hypothetical protein
LDSQSHEVKPPTDEFHTNDKSLTMGDRRRCAKL